MIATDEDTVGLYRGGKVTVADVPRQFRQMERIGSDDRVERLVRSHDLNMASVIEDNDIAVLEHDRFRQIEKHLAAVGQADRTPAQMALVVLQHCLCSWRAAKPDSFPF